MRTSDDPYGDQFKAKVRAANQLVVNLIILLCVAHTRKVLILRLSCASQKTVLGAKVLGCVCVRVFLYLRTICQDGTALQLTLVVLPRNVPVSGERWRYSHPYLDEEVWSPIAKTQRTLQQYSPRLAGSFVWQVVAKDGKNMAEHPAKQAVGSPSHP